MIRKRDFILIVGILALAAALYGGAALVRGSQQVSDTVLVYVDGELYATIPMDQPQTLRIEQETGEVNIVEIDENGAVMAYSSCKNQLCIEQGAVTRDNWTHRYMGRSIVCLPNRVVIELALEDAEQIQREEDLPDL